MKPTSAGRMSIPEASRRLDHLTADVDTLDAAWLKAAWPVTVHGSSRRKESSLDRDSASTCRAQRDSLRREVTSITYRHLGAMPLLVMHT